MARLFSSHRNRGCRHYLSGLHNFSAVADGRCRCRAGADRAGHAALMMVLFFQAARLAMVVFDPYLSSRPLAKALMESPPGALITQGFYWKFASVFFYTGRTGLLLSDRRMNLEHGANASGAPEVFIDDAQFKELWREPHRYYLLASQSALPRCEELVGASRLIIVRESGGKVLVTNQAGQF
jgi:hypothetical protein